MIAAGRSYPPERHQNLYRAAYWHVLHSKVPTFLLAEIVRCFAEDHERRLPLICSVRRGYAPIGPASKALHDINENDLEGRFAWRTKGCLWDGRSVWSQTDMSLPRSETLLAKRLSRHQTFSMLRERDSEKEAFHRIAATRRGTGERSSIRHALLVPKHPSHVAAVGRSDQCRQAADVESTLSGYIRDTV